jgi:hypothetical protein
VTRTPAAGNERITDDDFRRFVGAGLDLFRRLDDEGLTALRRALEWEGHARAATWDSVSDNLHDPDRELQPVRAQVEHQTSDGDPDRPPQQSDPTGEAAMRPDWTAGSYQLLCELVAKTWGPLRLLEGAMNAVTSQAPNATETNELRRLNATAGQCDACGRHHTGQRRPTDDRLKAAPQTGEPPRMYGPDCYSAWSRNLDAANPATVRVFERMRAQRLERTTGGAA